MSRPPIASIVGGTRRELIDMPWDEYLAFPALNASTIVTACVDSETISMRALKDYWDNGRKDTDALQFGRMLHCVLFESHDVHNRYRVWEGRRAGNDYKEAVAGAAACGAEIVRATGEYSMVDAINATPNFFADERVKAALQAGEAEKTILTVECGLQIKCRLDWISESSQELWDLKSTRTMSRRLFGRDFFGFHYGIKLGLYQRWLQRATGKEWPVMVAMLQNKRPYDYATVPIPAAVLEAGVTTGLKIIERVAKEIKDDKWPGVAGGELYPLHVPPYVMEDEEELPDTLGGEE